MPVTKEQLEEERQAARERKNQQQMERDLYGKSLDDYAPPLPPAKPGKPVEPTILPGKPAKKKALGDGAVNYSKGGSASSRADGIAQRGKTRGKMV